jgi:sarcosine oxidase, subunit gamma
MSEVLAPMAEVSALPPRGMITLRGDLADAALRALCREVTGVDVPPVGQVHLAGDTGLAWMSPDEVLLMLPQAQVPDALARIAAALAAVHHLAVDVSDARALFRLSGPGAREVLGKLCPVDLHPDHFGPGQFRRSKLGQIAAAFWMVDGQTFEVVCFRSVATYAHELLSVSAKAGPVGFYPSGV